MKRYKLALAIGGLIFLIGGFAFFFLGDNSEEITYAGGQGIFDDRLRVAVFEDRTLFDRASTKQLLLSWHSNIDTRSLRFYKRIDRLSIESSKSAVVYLIGTKCGEANILGSQASSLYLILPLTAPPAGEIPHLKAVILSANNTLAYTAQWAVWCGNHDIPCVNAIGESAESIVAAMKTAEPLVRAARQRQNAIEYQKHIERNPPTVSVGKTG